MVQGTLVAHLHAVQVFYPVGPVVRKWQPRPRPGAPRDERARRAPG